MAGGRPRTVSFPEDEMIALGEEMIQWLNDNPDTLHLTQWWSLHKLFTEEEWDAMQQMPEFLPYYKRALHLIGLKYLTKDSKVRDNISPRWQRVYFKDLRKSEDQDLDEAAARASKTETMESEEQKAKFDSSMLQVISLLSSNRNIDDKSISNDTKS
jgi:hypothetical protein